MKSGQHRTAENPWDNIETEITSFVSQMAFLLACSGLIQVLPVSPVFQPPVLSLHWIHLTPTPGCTWKKLFPFPNSQLVLFPIVLFWLHPFNQFEEERYLKTNSTVLFNLGS